MVEKLPSVAPSPRNFVVVIVIFCSLLIAGLWAAVVQRSEYERNEIVANELRQNANLALAFEGQLIRTLKGADVVLRNLIRDFRQSGSQTQVDQLFADLGLDPTLFTYLAVHDENGQRIVGPAGTPPADASDRDYFQYLKANPTAETFIGKSTIGKTSGKRSVHVARRINKPDGSFGGVAVIAMNNDYFAKFYDQADFGKGGIISITGFDGLVRIRNNARKGEEGSDLSKNPRFQKIVAERNEAPKGGFVAPSYVDGITRIVSFRVMTQYPLVVIVGSGEESVLAIWSQGKRNYYSGAAALTFVIVAFGLGAILSQRRQVRYVASLAASEAQFHAAFDQATVGMTTTNLAGEYTAVNRKFCDMLGYTPGELVGRDYRDITHPDDIAPNQNVRDGLLTSDANPEAKLNSAEKRFIDKSGNVVWARFSAALVPQTLQSPAYFVSVFQDLSDAKRTERQLTLLENCVQRLNDIVLITDAPKAKGEQPKIVFVNDAFVRTTGYSRDEVMGKTRSFLEGPLTNHSELERVAAALQAGNTARAELIKYKKNGEPYWAELEIVPVQDETREVTHFASVERDISERKLTEQIIARTSRVLRTLSLCNSTLVRAESEQALLKDMCDLAVGTGGFKLAWVGYANPDEQQQVVRQAHAGVGGGFVTSRPFIWSEKGPVESTVRSGKPSVVTHVNTAADFQPYLDEAKKHGFGGLVSLPLKENGQTFGTLVLYLAESRDIHPEEFALMEELAEDLAFGIVTLRMREARKNFQEEIVKLNAELETRVKHRTAQLESANKELEAFSYSISHDLRTPLRTVDGYSEMLMEDYGNLLPDEGKRVVEIIRGGAQQMGRLIDDLLQFARTGHCAMTSTPLDCEKMAKTALADLSSVYPGRQHQVTIGALPACIGDGPLLAQVWSNLISNALKYTSKRSEPAIEVGSTEIDGKSTYFVRDNGAGFDMKYAHKLFGVFERLHGADEFSGTGVGLAIVNRIIERHGGHIWAESAINVGTTFFFQLPKEAPIE